MVKFDRFEFFCLSGVYSIMCFYAFYRLAQIHSRIPKKWTFQKKRWVWSRRARSVSTDTLIFSNLSHTHTHPSARAVLFVVTGLDMENHHLISPLHTDFNKDWSYLLSTLPNLLFVSVYCLLVAFWSQLASNDWSSVKRFMSFTILMTWIFYGVYLVAVELSDHDRDRLHTVPDTYFATLNAFLSCAVLYFGMRVQYLLESVPIDRELRFSKLNELIIMTVICSVAFMTRSVVAIVVGCSSASITVQNVRYFVFNRILQFLEILPLTVMLWYLRNLPPREQQITFDIVLGSGDDVDDDDDDDDDGLGDDFIASLPR